MIKTLVTLFTVYFVASSQWFFGEIRSLSRSIDIQGIYVDSIVTIEFENTHNQAVNQFYYAVSDQFNSTLVLATFDDGQDNEVLPSIVSDPNLNSIGDFTLYSYEFPKRMLPGDVRKFKIREQFYKRFQPLPKAITFQDNQFVVFTDSKFFYSPYKVKKQSTVYVAGRIFEYTGDENDDTIVQKGNRVRYGDFLDQDAFQFEEVRIHYQNNQPLAYFTNVTKKIQVSHWGNINVDSQFSVVNAGAELKGEFNRLSRNFKNVAEQSIKQLSAELPYHAWGVSYGDEIGNNTKSHAWRSKQDKVVHIDVQPRFPLLGGWKSNFNLGYNLNSSRYIYETEQNSNQYLLKQLFSYPFLDLIAEDYELQVQLPQGAYDIDVTLPFTVDRQWQETIYSYLEIEGRPTLFFSKQLVSGFYNQFFYVTYKLDSSQMYNKFLLLLGAFSSFFFFIILINRMGSGEEKKQRKLSE